MKHPLKQRSRIAHLRRSRLYRPCLETLEDRFLLSDFTLGHLVQVSHGDPFADCTADDIEHQPGFVYPATEVESSLAVDPTDPNHLVGAFQQDRWSNGANRGLTAGVSFDGGRHWREVVIPGLTLCSGGTFHRAGDPWVSFAPNGDLYESAVLVDKGASGFNARNAIVASKSTDGGMSWTAPVTIDLQFPAETGLQGVDFSRITADPTDPRIAYIVWRRQVQPPGSDQPRWMVMFSRTTTGGRTWEPGRILYDAGPGPFLTGVPLVVQPDGTLIDFLTVTNPGADSEFGLLRSFNRGETWTPQAIPIATQQPVPVTDPDNGQPVTTAIPLDEVADDPSNGNLYAVWEDGRFNGRQHDAIVFSMSTDGGLTWSEPIQINQTPTDIDPGDQQAFLPAIQVAQNGTVGVTYYDFRFNDPEPGLATDYWFVHAHPGDPGGLTNPANWAHEVRLTNRSFDLERAPVARAGFFLGDYEGLASSGNSFLPFWAQPKRTDPDHIFFRRIEERHDRRDGNEDGRTGEAPAAANWFQTPDLRDGLASVPPPGNLGRASGSPTGVTIPALTAVLGAGNMDQASGQLPVALVVSSSRRGGPVHERVFAEFEGDWVTDGVVNSLIVVG